MKKLFAVALLSSLSAFAFDESCSDVYQEKNVPGLHMAVGQAQIDDLKMMLSLDQTNPNEADEWGRTALFYAYFSPKIDTNDKKGRKTASDIADLLIKDGANLEARDKRGFTAMFCAIDNCNFEAVKALAEKGARLDGFGPREASAGMVAEHALEITRALHKSGSKASKRLVPACEKTLRFVRDQMKKLRKEEKKMIEESGKLLPPPKGH
jgi:ankyrin repeat protein